MDPWNHGAFCICILFLLLTVNSSMQNQLHDQIQQHKNSLPELVDEAATALVNAVTASISTDDLAFLAEHNKVRLHKGEPPFVWDAKLASYALQYAEKRKADCNLIHSNGPYGENIFWGGGNQWQATDAVRLWVKEHRYYDASTMSCKPGKLCGHYTQIVWRDSARLGCARVECNNGDTFAICSYDPPGNYVGENPFNINIKN